jgi:uncharacterized lipoprotein YajG
MEQKRHDKRLNPKKEAYVMKFAIPVLACVLLCGCASQPKAVHSPDLTEDCRRRIEYALILPV